ncbi:hypothetical protein FOCC_FOCC012658 [Frankliniella occidentalis]|nr:hypothetical protein FOCC_FOCC012658 [Frankliniella occidentalis]
MFKTLENPLKLMETEHQRLNEFEDMGCYIPPESIEIGVVDEYDHINQVDVVQNRPVFVQVVPLRKSLKAFLEMPGMLSAISEHMLTLEHDISGKISSILQGGRWKEIKLRFRDKFFLPLNLAFDDVEPDNALGSPCNEHKLGNLYAEIPCLPPEIKSALDNILLVSTFESKHRKAFGNSVVFDSVIQELKFLEEEGIAIEIDGEVRQVYFCLLLIIGDNLGLNGILGFVEGFRGNHFCRICKLHRDATEHTCIPAPTDLRTVQNYRADVATNDSYFTGVKEECLWNSLASYHCIEAGVCDVMHDINEGLLKYSIANVLFYLVNVRDYLSIETLNDRIDGFNYGPSEKGNKPPTPRITIESLRNCSVNLSATEMLCLGRYLGEMIGDLIPKNNAIWKFYILVREILEIIFSPFYVPGVPDYLQILIAEHHELYIRYFGSLKPKHHLMIHYPMLMERNGPLLSSSAFLSERNHRKAKKYAKSSMSRVNLPLSVAIKYQLYFCERVMRKDHVLQQRLSMSKVSHCPLYSLENSAFFLHLLHIDMNADIISPKRIALYGTVYSTGMVLVTDVGDYLPTFGKIVHIVISDNRVTFVLNLMRTVRYCQHICAYEVVPSENWMCLPHSECVDYTPLWPRFSIETGNNVVSLRHSL